MIRILLGAILLHGGLVQSWTTPEREEEIVTICANRESAPLSEALLELIQDISDQTFTKDFFAKIIQLEEKKFTGEYIDHWENGKLKIKAFFKEGKVDGHVHGWFENGEEAFKAFFYENIKAGIHFAFFPYGAPRRCPMGIARRLSYDFEGRLDGEQESSEYDGGLKSLIRYKHGLLHGSKVLYNSERKCIKDEFYEEGKLVPGKTTERRK